MSYETVEDIQNREFDRDANAKRVTQATILDPVNDAVTSRPEGYKTASLTASGLVYTGTAVLGDIIIISHTAGATVRVSDALTATTPYLSSAQTTVAGHTSGYPLLPACAKKMSTGIYVTITGTIEVLVKYLPLTQVHNNV